MKPISEERIRETFGYYEGSQVQRSGDGWVVLMPSGRTVNIHPYHIDFRGITKRLPGEAEKDRDDLQFELMTLAVDVWGLVSLISYHGEHKDEGFRLWVYAKAYKLPVEGAWWPFSTTQAQKYFENDAAKVRLVIGGYRISLPDGKSVLIGLSCGEMIITKVRGGAEMYASSLKLLQSLQDRAYVSGSYSFCATMVAHAEREGIRVIPEIPLSFFKKVAIAHIAHLVATVLVLGAEMSGWFGEMPFERAAIRAFVIGWIAALVFVLCLPVQKWARKRGEALINKFPSSQSSGNRKANMDDAKARGML